MDTTQPRISATAIPEAAQKALDRTPVSLHQQPMGCEASGATIPGGKTHLQAGSSPSDRDATGCREVDRAVRHAYSLRRMAAGLTCPPMRRELLLHRLADLLRPMPTNCRAGSHRHGKPRDMAAMGDVPG